MTGPRSNNFWPDGIISTVTTTLWLLNHGDWSETWNAVLSAFKLLTKIGLVIYLVIELLRIRAFTDVLAASARIFLFFLLLVNTWIMPWYFTWSLALSAALGWGDRLVRICAGFTMTAMILMYQRQWTQTLVEERGGVFLVLPIILVLLPDAARLARRILLRPTRNAPARVGRSSVSS
jgi:hypothetical protein